MPTRIKIEKEYLKGINEVEDPIAEIHEFLQDHAFSNLLDYHGVIQFDGYEDDNSDPKIIVMKSSMDGNKLTIHANLEYNLLEQQNSCADSLATIKHSARLVYLYEMGDKEISFELDPVQLDEDYHPFEYGG